jgi:hypothetical protein
LSVVDIYSALQNSFWIRPELAYDLEAYLQYEESSPLKTFILALVLAFPALSQSPINVKTNPLSVCDIQARRADWDNNVVLVKAHYGSGMEDSFLWDEKCPGKDIELEYPEQAEEIDKSLGAAFPSKSKPVSLSRDDKFLQFEKLVSIRDENNIMCQKLDVVIEAVGRIDTKREAAKSNPNCRLPFGMCNYSARFILQSVKDVHAVTGKPMCK